MSDSKKFALILLHFSSFTLYRQIHLGYQSPLRKPWQCFMTPPRFLAPRRTPHKISGHKIHPARAPPPPFPLFAGIYARGAGIGPASTFLYSGPAINVLAIILTARVLGFEMGLASILFSIVIGLAMSIIFRKDEEKRQESFAVAKSHRLKPPVGLV
ncbi:permease [Acetomicrobium sp.]|uniref:permease n=1 Tax=Acetomicrobium sp. TaxID=1872099 RepID=UPI0028720249|nr:permease [Acetomicrobium sp.]MDR9770078.1 permease [Acetomicrobium sp.]